MNDFIYILISIRVCAGFIVLMSFITAQPVQAQTNHMQPAGVASVIDTPLNNNSAQSPLENPSAWVRILDTTEQAISRKGVTNADLLRLLNETEQIRRASVEQIKLLELEVERVRQQLTELGPPPGKEEAPETEVVKKRRAEIGHNFSTVDSRLKSARVTEVRSQQLRKTIADIQNRRFVQSISAHNKELVTIEFWERFIKGFAGFGRSIYLLMYDAFSVMADKLANEPAVLLFLISGLGGVALVSIRIRRFLDNIGERATDLFGTLHVGNMRSGFIQFLRSGILPSTFLVAVYGIFFGLELLTQRLDQLLYSVIAVTGFAIAAMALFRIYLAPLDSSQRLLPLSDRAALRIFALLSGALIALMMLVILEQLSNNIVAPIEVNIGLSLVSAVLIAVITLVALLIVRKDRHAHPVINTVPMPRTMRYLYLAVWPVSLIILIAAFLGYIAFAKFLSEQLLFGAFVVLSVWLLLHFIDFILLHFPLQVMPGDEARKQTDLGTDSATHSGQFMILAAGLLKLATYVFAVLLLLLPWGYRTSDFFDFVNRAFFGFEIGGLSISLSTILLAILLFAIGYVVTTGLRNWLSNRFLPATRLDIGISNSISTVFGYSGIILAGILAVSVAGFDLSNLAIVAGALSVGVGFGLQSIVNNFVSGLILLAERPIKAGDWIETSGGEGYVRKISVRSTEIETFDRATVIVPNSTLITDTVTNRTHGGKSGRIIIPVGVAYDSDPRQVHDILIECAKNHSMVVGRPAPVVFFTDFGASSLDFQLRCFLADINNGMSVKSDLRFEILTALRKAGIEIPFPQQELHIRSDRIALSDTPGLFHDGKPA